MSCLATITRWNRYTSSQETPLTIQAWEILERMSGKVLQSRGLLQRCQSRLRQWSPQDSNTGTRKDLAPCRTGSRDAGRACGAAYTWLEMQPAAHLLGCGKMLSPTKSGRGKRESRSGKLREDCCSILKSTSTKFFLNSILVQFCSDWFYYQLSTFRFIKYHSIIISYEAFNFLIKYSTYIKNLLLYSMLLFKKQQLQLSIKFV